MRKISEFYGISVYMYFLDHAPPHFHAIYVGNEALISLETGEILRGRLPPRAAALVSEWVRLRRTELSSCVGAGGGASPDRSVEPLV